LSSVEKAQELYNTHIPLDKAVSLDFWKNYNTKEQLIGLKATLATHIVTGFKKIPQRSQLEATIALCTNKDTIINVGTGYGKTFCMILPVLLSPNSVSFVVSPLKKL
ncbi:hypothetical protein BDQ17DRAFT_1227707, partial [Cyathus striatus]